MDLIYMKKETWKSILDRIREKVGTTALMTAEEAAEAIENIAGGGGGEGSSFELLYRTEVQASTTSTSRTALATLMTGIDVSGSDDQRIFVRVRDKAGKRAGYFYQSEMHYDMEEHRNGQSSGESGTIGTVQSISDSGVTSIYRSYGNPAALYGVYPGIIYADGRIAMYTRYNLNYGRIDGTYIVEVYRMYLPGSDAVMASEPAESVAEVLSRLEEIYND